MIAPLAGTDPRYTTHWVCDIPLSCAWLLREVTREGTYPIMTMTEELEQFMRRALPERYRFLRRIETLRTVKKRLPAYVVILSDANAASRLAFWLRNKPKRADVYLFNTYDEYAEFSYGSL